MKAPGLIVVLVALVALAGCAQAVRVTGPFPVERVVPFDSAGPIAEEADLVVWARVDRAVFAGEEVPDGFTLVVDGRRISGKAAPEGTGEADIIVYGPKGRVRLASGLHEVSLGVGGTGFMTAVVELRGGKVHELVFEPVYGRHKHIRKRALRLLSRERVFPLELTGFKAYLDGGEVVK